MGSGAANSWFSGKSNNVRGASSAAVSTGGPSSPYKNLSCGDISSILRCCLAAAIADLFLLYSGPILYNSFSVSFNCADKSSNASRCSGVASLGSFFLPPVIALRCSSSAAFCSCNWLNVASSSSSKYSGVCLRAVSFSASAFASASFFSCASFSNLPRASPRSNA